MKKPVSLNNLMKGLRIIATYSNFDEPIICNNELWIGENIAASNEDIQKLNALGFTLDYRGFFKIRF